MSFTTGRSYRLKASKREFKVLTAENYIGMVEVKFVGDREPLTIMASQLRAESEEIPGA